MERAAKITRNIGTLVLALRVADTVEERRHFGEDLEKQFDLAQRFRVDMARKYLSATRVAEVSATQLGTTEQQLLAAACSS
jgi:hypothetical protein